MDKQDKIIELLTQISNKIDALVVVEYANQQMSEQMMNALAPKDEDKLTNFHSQGFFQRQ